MRHAWMAERNERHQGEGKRGGEREERKGRGMTELRECGCSSDLTFMS